MWTAVTSLPDGSAPSARSKHSATLLGAHVYLLGGRNGNLPLKDLWRYSLAESKWEPLQATGDRPPCLQEHSAVAYRENIYVFGGELGFSAGTETPLWIYQVKTNSWRKVRVQKGVTVPRGRRGHTALVHRGSMLIYGGYQDLRGSSNELWAFDFETESWHLLCSSKGGRPSSDLPAARHKHSAILHDDAMWIYGGMTDLHERGDFWKFDTVSKTWTCMKAKPGPGALHSHAACKLPSSMLIFGGERDGHPTCELWRYHFGTATWERLNIPGLRPQPRAESVALAISELLFSDPQKELALKEAADKDNVHRTETPTTNPSRTLRPRGGGSVDRSTNQRPSTYHPNNRISPCEKKYVFKPTSVNYVDGSVVNRSGDDSNSKRTNLGNGMAQTPGGTNTSFLKEISKLSQINLSRLSHHKCSYSVLCSSKDDSTSTESLLHPGLEANAKRDGDDKEGAPKLTKSQSATVISRRRLVTAASPDTPNPVSILRHQNGCRNPVLKTPTEKITRDQFSVPNFGAISTLPTPVLTPIEVTRLVFLESDDDIENDVIDNVHGRSAATNGIILVQEQQSFSTLHQQFQPKDSKRSESYNSHLVSAGVDGSVYQNVTSRSIPKSASVRFRKDHSVVEFEDSETVSTSDYASIEAVNNVLSASNYSMKASPDGQYADDYQNFKVGRKNKNNKNGPFGFSNPNYLGPDIQTILGGQRKTWHVTTPTEVDKFTRQQSFQRVLNSPPDSVLEDVNGRSISRQFYQEELVELQNLQSPNATTPGQSVPKFPPDPGTRVPPHFLALSGTNQPMGVEKRKNRASSASRAERQHSLQEREVAEDVSSLSVEPPLYVFIVGGKEQGQVTVFKRPVSVWKLQLAANVF